MNQLDSRRARPRYMAEAQWAPVDPEFEPASGRTRPAATRAKCCLAGTILADHSVNGIALEGDIEGAVERGHLAICNANVAKFESRRIRCDLSYLLGGNSPGKAALRSPC